MAAEKGKSSVHTVIQVRGSPIGSGRSSLHGDGQGLGHLEAREKLVCGTVEEGRIMSALRSTDYRGKVTILRGSPTAKLLPRISCFLQIHGHVVTFIQQRGKNI